MSNIIEITDFLAPELDVYARLTEVQLLNNEFPEKGLFIAESPKVIERALDAGYEPVSCLMEKKHILAESRLQEMLLLLLELAYFVEGNFMKKLDTWMKKATIG